MHFSIKPKQKLKRCFELHENVWRDYLITDGQLATKQLALLVSCDPGPKVAQWPEMENRVMLSTLQPFVLQKVRR